MLEVPVQLSASISFDSGRATYHHRIRWRVLAP